MKKDEVEHHSDGYRPSHPALNIKVGNLWRDVERAADEVCKDNGDEEPARFKEWLHDVVWDHDEPFNSAWESARESVWEMIETDAADIFPQSVKVYSEGRSGGWLVVHGLPDVEKWDAVLVAKWSKFARFVADYLKGFGYDVCWQLHANAYESWKDEDNARRSLAYVGADRLALTS